MIRLAAAILISIALALMFFSFIPALHAQLELDSDALKIREEMKRSREEALKAIELMKENEQKIKEATGKINLDSSQARRALKQAWQDRLDIQKQVKGLFNQQDAVIGTKGVRKGTDFIVFFKENFIKILLGLICIIILYVCYRILIYEKKPALTIGRGISSNILARVNKWSFTEGDFKICLDILKAAVDPKVLDVNSREFAAHFIDDLVVTEIVYQITQEKKIEEGPESIDILPGNLDFFSGSDSPLLNSRIISSLQNYSVSIHTEVGPREYSIYYRYFLSLLLIIASRDASGLFEFRSKFVLVNKLFSELEKDIEVSLGEIKNYYEDTKEIQGKDFPQVTDEIKRDIRAVKLKKALGTLVGEFMSRSEVVVRLD